jgi:hypothetical protein
MRFFGSGHTIRKNKIHDIYLSDPENGRAPHIDCVQSWGPACNITFEQNDFSLAGEPNATKQIAMISYGDQSTVIKNLTFRNNIFHDVYRGLNLFGSMDGYPNTPLDAILVVNNTFAYFTNNPIELHDCHNAKILNNIFFNSRQVWTDDNSRANLLEIAYNCYFRNDGIRQLKIIASSNDLVNIDPGFINPKERNFHIRKNSALAGKGIIIPEVKNDYDGRVRPAGSKGYDIGAFIISD